MTVRDRKRKRTAVVLVLSVTFGASIARAQIPGLPAAPAPASKGAEPEKKESVATTAGPIKVKTGVSDHAVERTLEDLLPKYPGVRDVDATVEQGVVTLEGQVDDDDTRDQMTQVAKQIEGVRLVINKVATDAEVLTAWQLVMEKIASIWELISRRWLLALLSLLIVVAFAGAARVFNAYAETLLAPFVKNVMLRAVAGSLVSSALVLGGLTFGLSILNLTHAVASVIGLAGVITLAVGFAFKDIAENFIASILLGVRRPFRVGDYITVAGQTGVVRSLNTRATVLVTLEGNHVRIPNNIVYKEILINATASVSYRSSFDVLVPYEASTAAATEAMNRALRQGDGILNDPPARALVEALEPGGVRIRAYYWVPVQGIDWFQLNSDAKLRVKVALQQAGVLGAPSPAPAPATVAIDGRPAEPSPAAEAAASQSAAKAEANLRKDARAAEHAKAVSTEGQPSPMERALDQAENRVSEEGANLLVEAHH